MRPNEELFFANARPLQSTILALVDSSGPSGRGMLLDLEMTADADVPAADMLAELHEEAEGSRGRAVPIPCPRTGP